MDRYRPAMRGFLEQLFAAIPADGRAEFIADFAKPYPSLVIAEVMGAPLEDAPRLHHWSNWIQRQFDATSLMTERERIEEAVAEFYAYEDELIARRRTTPGDDLISALLSAEEQGDRLSHDELRNLVLNILVGGVDTSQSQLAHAVRLLAQHPDQWEALRADPQNLALAAVDESLRFEPITPFTARIVTGELEFRGITFAPGSIVLISAWHANREGVEPDSFDITATARPRPSPDLRRRHPLLRRREPGARRDAGGAGLPGRARARHQPRRRADLRHAVRDLRARVAAGPPATDEFSARRAV